MLLNKVLVPIADTCFSWENKMYPDKVVRWCPDGDFLHPVFPASRMQYISDLHSKFALGHAMCGSMADIQSATAEIIGYEKRKKPQHENCLLYTSPSPRDRTRYRMPSSA